MPLGTASEASCMASARIFTAYRPTRREVYLEKSGHVIEKGSPDLRNKANCPVCAADAGTGVHRQPASRRSKDPTAQRQSPTSREHSPGEPAELPA